MSKQGIEEHGRTSMVEQGYWFYADTNRHASCSTISNKQEYIHGNEGIVIVSQKIEQDDINQNTTGNNRGGEKNPITPWAQKEHTNRVEFWITGSERSEYLLQGLGIDIEICLTIRDREEEEVVYSRVLLAVEGTSKDVLVDPCGLCFFAYFTPSHEEIGVNEKHNIPSGVDAKEIKHRFLFTVRCKMYDSE